MSFSGSVKGNVAYTNIHNAAINAPNFVRIIFSAQEIMHLRWHSLKTLQQEKTLEIWNDDIKQLGLAMEKIKILEKYESCQKEARLCFLK